MWDICRKECIPIWCKQSNADHAPPNFPSPDWIPPTLLFPNHTVPFHRPLFFPTSCRLPQRTRPLPPTLCQSTNYHKASKTIRCQHNLVHSNTKKRKLAETRGDKQRVQSSCFVPTRPTSSHFVHFVQWKPHYLSLSNGWGTNQVGGHPTKPRTCASWEVHRARSQCRT